MPSITEDVTKSEEIDFPVAEPDKAEPSKKKNVAMDLKSNRTLLISSKDGVFRITIPASFKVTFGKQQPGSNSYNDREGIKGMTLRIYESENKQRAVFQGVYGFRDLSLPVEYLTVEEGEAKWEEQNGEEFISQKTFRALRDDK